MRKHYQGVIREAVFRQTLDHDVRAHVSYRMGDQVLWTTKQVTIKAGEQVLTDGHAVIRTRCGNLISPTVRVVPGPARPPVVPVEPPEVVFDTQLPPLIPPLIPPPSVPYVTAKLPPALVNPPSPLVPSPSPISPPGLVPPIWPEHHDPRVPAPVPEPASLLLIGTGLTALAGYIAKQHRE